MFDRKMRPSERAGESLNERLIRLVARIGYTGRHRALPSVGRHLPEISASAYVTVDELLADR